MKGVPFVSIGDTKGATRRAHNPNLQVVITHASHVCSQHSFGLPLRMNRELKNHDDGLVDDDRK